MGIEQLKPSVYQKLMKAGKNAFVVGYNRATGIMDATAINESHNSYDIVMLSVDKHYGQCTCLEEDVVKPCPSVEEHCLVAGFIDDMELAGYKSGESGKILNRETISDYMYFVVNHFRRWE